MLTNHASGRPVQHVTHAWPAMKCHAKRTLAFLATALPLSGKSRACTRTPQSFASGFRAAAPFLFSRCFALCITHCALFHLPYSFTGFSFYFFVFFRLFLHWIYAFCICNSTYVYIYKQVLSLPVKSSMCPSRLSCSVWYRVIPVSYTHLDVYKRQKVVLLPGTMGTSFESRGLKFGTNKLKSLDILGLMFSVSLPLILFSKEFAGCGAL